MKRIVLAWCDRLKSLSLGIVVCLLCASLILGCSVETKSTDIDTEIPDPPTLVPVPTPSTPTESPVTSSPADAPQMSTALRDNLLAAIARDQSVPVDQLQLLDATAQTWPDGCLGLADEGEICTMALVEGWIATVTDGETTWIYRTDSTGTQIRFDANA